MSTARPFAYNTGAPIDGTEQVGNLAIGWPADGFDSTGIEWWNGPDEDLGYVVAKEVPADDQPTPVGYTASVGFSRTNGFDDNEFIGIANILTGNTYGNASLASDGLTSNGFWNSYTSESLIMDLDSTIGVTSLSWSDNSGNNNDADINGGIDTTIYNGSQVVRFNGTTGWVYPSAGFSTSLDAGFTYEIWAYPTVPTNGTLIGEWGGRPPTGWTDAQMGFVSGSINSGVYPASNFSPSPGYINGPSFSSGVWYNIVMTYDGTTLSQYINGSIVGSVTGTKANPVDRHLTLGLPDGVSGYIGGASGYFRGFIGSWRIWDGALKSGRILSNYNSTKSRFGL